MLIRRRKHKQITSTPWEEHRRDHYLVVSGQIEPGDNIAQGIGIPVL